MITYTIGSKDTPWLWFVLWLATTVFLTLNLGCSYDRFEPSPGPEHALEAAQDAWESYGRADATPVEFRWLKPPGDCDDEGGFIARNGQCVWAEYEPTLNTAYVLDKAAVMQPGSKDGLGNVVVRPYDRRAGTICHETLHAVLDAERGVSFDSDSGHEDPRWHTELPACYLVLANYFRKSYAYAAGAVR